MAQINPLLIKDPEGFASKHPSIRKIHDSRTSKNGVSKLRLNLDLLTFKGINIDLRLIGKSKMAQCKITFNPGVCLYGHNGRILTTEEWIDALSILGDSIGPLLKNPDDWIDLIPGLNSSSQAYWKDLEIPFHCPDSQSLIFRAFLHGKHPSIKRKSRLWPTSIIFPGTKLKISVYQKVPEMIAHEKLTAEEAQEFENILRIEVKLSKEMVVSSLRNSDNTRIIDGKERLIHFQPQDLIATFHRIIGGFQGVFKDEIPADKSEKRLRDHGRFFATIAGDPRTNQTLDELVALLVPMLGASENTMRKIRKYGLHELSRLSPILFGSIFNASGYRDQPCICSPHKEKLIRHTRPDHSIRTLIEKVYDSFPSKRFIPHQSTETYFH